MSEPFLITGLPRSRTAWFSVVATGPKSICYHEPVARLSDFEALKDLWLDDRFQYVGVSDSSLVFQLGRILDEVGARTLVIRREPADVVRSLDLYFAPSDLAVDTQTYAYQADAQLDMYRHHPKVMFMDFDEAASEESVIAALQWLMPTETFPKLSELMHMNVQVDLSWVLGMASQPHTNWHLDTSWQARP